MYWLLAPEDQRYVLAMTAEQGFAGEQSTRALTFAQMYDLLGDAAKTRMYADSARILIAAELRDLPDDGQRNVLYGLALAFLGRRDEAIAAGERGVKLSEDRANHFQAAYNRHQLARIYLELGEQDRALDLLERLLREPYYLSPAWLREDQTLAKLRGNPRFAKLASQ
jgi:tetratricopeptide (TPR) repeat protein